MIHPNTVVQCVSPVIGNGVFATADISAGTVVVVRDRFDTCLSRSEFEELPEILRQSMETYMYHDRHGNLVLSWDHARYMNHSCCSNTMMTAYDLEIAVRDIRAGEELTSEYGLLNIQEPYEIHCDCPNCRKRLRLDDIDVYGREWDRRILHALMRAPSLARDSHQPLWNMISAEIRDAVTGLQQVPDMYVPVGTLKWRMAEAPATWGAPR